MPFRVPRAIGAAPFAPDCARVCQNPRMQTIRRRVARWAIGVMIMAIAGMPGGTGAQELTELSAGEAAARIRAGTLRSEDLVRALVDMTERRRDLNAFITFDREHALVAA